MTNSPIPNDPLRQAGLPSVGPASGKPVDGAAKAESSAAFRALLDSLAQKASDLGEASQTLGAPEELASAIDDARKSLDDAASLGDRLLEAYRANQLQDSSSADEEGKR